MGGKGGGDCSERFCPYELAWVDNPLVDGSTHNYAECANKGTCNRETGECKCFPGYEGKACGRQACPEYCSGHGTCEYMKDLTYGETYNVYNNGGSLSKSGLGTGGKKLDDYSWDTERARKCVCDGGWTGLACEKRMCPVGNDIMDVIPDGYGSYIAQVQTITLYDADDTNSNFAGKSFALQYTTLLNETFVTQPIMWSTVDSTLETHIKNSLMELPNKVIDEVTVSVDSSVGSNGVVINITFNGNTVQGAQYPLEVLADTCTEGCTPLITGLTNLRTFHASTLSTVEISTVGTHPNVFECGLRGKCNYATGLCQCYDGYAGDACNIFQASV